MKNLKTIFKQAHLAIVGCLFCASMGYAQIPVIQVPPGCVVVNVGSGGTLGAGGKVGNGGIITMPDPYAGDTFTFLPNNTTVPLVTNTVGTWRLLGDLSDTNNATTSDAPVQPAGTPLAVKIMSYNKKSRAAEYPPVSPSSSIVWARSKGRVTVTYSNNNGCGNSLIFDVYKEYAPLPNATAPTNIPKIIGPDCLLPLTVYTYSVDQIASDNATDAIGFDSYYWSGFPAGYTDSYYSADKSSVTFKTGASVPAFSLRCDYGRANIWDGDTFAVGAPHSTYVTKPIGAQPVSPTFTSTLPISSTCLNTGVSSFPIVLNSLGYTYTLTAPGTTWNIIQNSVGNWTINTGTDNNPGTLQLTVTNGSCQPVIFTYPINRNFVAPSAVISGPTCVTAGTTTNAYSIQTNAVLNPTTWTLPSGWSITPLSANGTNSALSITVPSTGTGSTAGAYILYAKSNGCAGTINLTVNVKPAAPVISSSPVCVVRGTTATPAFFCTAITGATGYAWNLAGAPGWTCNTGCTTNTPTFIPNGSTAGPANITVTALGANGCNSNSSANFQVNYTPVTPTIAPVTACFDYGISGGTKTITVTNPQNFGTYAITSVPNTLFSSAVYSAGVFTLTTTGIGGSYNITVTHSNGTCTPATSVAVPISVASIAGSTSIALNPSNPCDQYSVSSLPVGSTYVWKVNGATPTGPNYNIFGNGITMCGTTAPSSVCVDVTLNGCTSRVCSATIGTHALRQGNGTLPDVKSNSVLDQVKIYPNPNTGVFTIQVDNVKTSATATILDATGKIIATYTLKKGENKIQQEGLPKGVYTVSLKLDGKSEARQIIIK
ncbi:MAG TPA: T9SS type A sorting domain-containing protein [Flavobacterium sp.]|nr:T9SS type A sorting domain-containing protein [Flavobacterium sp.]